MHSDDLIIEHQKKLTELTKWSLASLSFAECPGDRKKLFIH
jgi:hypothetical protein